MRSRALLVVWLAAVSAGVVAAADRSWENPVFLSEREAVAAAESHRARLAQDDPPGLRFFVELTLAAGDVGARHPAESITRRLVEDVVLTHPAAFATNPVQKRTIERFTAEMPGQMRVLEKRLARFGYPELPGLVYLRLVDSVDAFAGLNRASSDRMSRVGGVTYYCRYVVLPLSYIGEESLRELRRQAVRNPSLDVHATIQTWQRESFASLVNTFRHELVHVHTNSTLDVPAYSNRTAFPTWFHEGTATYLAADPHSGLSERYQEYQDLFFYLVQRHGVRDLQSFYAGVLKGSDVKSVLQSVYAISSGDQLFVRSARWHRAKDVLKTCLWVLALAVIIAAFRGADLPVLGALQLLAALTLGLAIATGLAEHLHGLRGPGAVLAAKFGFGFVGMLVGLMGISRIRRHLSKRGAA